MCNVGHTKVLQHFWKKRSVLCLLKVFFEAGICAFRLGVFLVFKEMTFVGPFVWLLKIAGCLAHSLSLINWLRSTMTQKRLNGIAVSYFHQDRLDKLDSPAIFSMEMKGGEMFLGPIESASRGYMCLAAEGILFF